MLKYFKILLAAIFLALTFGCTSSDITLNDKQRIVGIINACKSDKQQMNEYLKYKVQHKEISQLVSFVIQECLK